MASAKKRRSAFLWDRGSGVLAGDFCNLGAAGRHIIPDLLLCLQHGRYLLYLPQSIVSSAANFQLTERCTAVDDRHVFILDKKIFVVREVDYKILLELAADVRKLVKI